jgi:hypothetical protein
VSAVSSAHRMPEIMSESRMNIYVPTFGWEGVLGFEIS